MEVESYEHAGIPVKIVYDSMPEYADPRDGDLNLGGMVTFHRDYIFGSGEQDKSHASPDIFEVECPLCEGYGYVDPYPGSPEPDSDGDVECPACEGTRVVTLNPVAYFKREYGARVVLKLGLIDHSGLSMYVGGGSHWSDSAGWDSGTIGFIFDSAEGRKTCGIEDWTDEQLTGALTSEVEAFDQFLRGEVYAFIVAEDEDDEEAVGGFLGDLDYVKSEANEVAEYVAERRAKEAREAAYWAARGVLTV